MTIFFRPSMELIDRLKRLNRKDFQRIVFSFVAEFSTAINQFSNDERGIENCLFDDCICGVIILLEVLRRIVFDNQVFTSA